MEPLYQKMYAYLAGQVDDVPQQIAGDLTGQTYGWKELNSIGESLKNALLTAEEMYLEGER